MKAFQFSLENVLQYRLEQEKEWEVKLGAAVGACNRLEQNIREIQDEEKQSLEERHLEDAASARAWGLYRTRLRQNQDRCYKELEKAKKEMEKVREGYLDASRKRKSLDKLKEKKQKEYQKYLLQEEHKMMDQLTAQKASREDDQ